jgi:hypothetical protein
MATVTIMLEKSPRIPAGDVMPFTVTVQPAPDKAYLLSLWAEGQGTFWRSQAKLHTVADPQDGNTYGLTLVGHGTSTAEFLWDTSGVPEGRFRMTVYAWESSRGEFSDLKDAQTQFLNRAKPPAPRTPVAILAGKSDLPPQLQVTEAVRQPAPVTMRRAESPPTPDQALWTVIRNSANALSFNNYNRFMDLVLCGEDIDLGMSDGDLQHGRALADRVRRRLRLPFPDTDAYRQLKVATEVFVMLNCGVFTHRAKLLDLDRNITELDAERRRHYQALQPGDIENLWSQLLSTAPLDDVDRQGRPIRTLPYLAIIRRKLKDVAVIQPPGHDRHRWLQEDDAAAQCLGILMEKLTHPCLLELIWSYWHEEGMLVQTMNAITWRFQNRRGPADRDPLALVEIDPLRPLNNFIWGYIQDEQHRLTVPRRAYEYDHHYGLTLLGKAVPAVRGADSRSRFLEGFHNLLFRCSIFFKEDDDTTVVADGFPVLNALKEVHLQLTQGAHNQYGDLPWTARQEMLMQEWLLARPEMREFLPSRVMVDYPEPWMDRVETMKTLQGWTDTSVMHFRDLGVFGEQVLLSIRFGAWPSIIEPQNAANWARYWRPEIQGYIHAYRAVTGVDLTERIDATLPAILLQQRLTGRAAAPYVVSVPLPSQVGQLPSRAARR